MTTFFSFNYWTPRALPQSEYACPPPEVRTTPQRFANPHPTTPDPPSLVGAVKPLRLREGPHAVQHRASLQHAGRRTGGQHQGACTGRKERAKGNTDTVLNTVRLPISLALVSTGGHARACAPARPQPPSQRARGLASSFPQGPLPPLPLPRPSTTSTSPYPRPPAVCRAAASRSSRRCCSRGRSSGIAPGSASGPGTAPPPACGSPGAGHAPGAGQRGGQHQRPRSWHNQTGSQPRHQSTRFALPSFPVPSCKVPSSLPGTGHSLSSMPHTAHAVLRCDHPSRCATAGSCRGGLAAPWLPPPPSARPAPPRPEAPLRTGDRGRGSGEGGASRKTSLARTGGKGTATTPSSLHAARADPASSCASYAQPVSPQGKLTLILALCCLPPPAPAPTPLPPPPRGCPPACPARSSC